MPEYLTSTDLRFRLTEVIRALQAGKKFIVTKNGKALAFLRPVEYTDYGIGQEPGSPADVREE